VTIRQIQDQSGASIQVPKTGNIDNPALRTLQITHPDPQGAAFAKQLVEDILKSKPSFAASNGNNEAHQQQQQQHHQASIQISVPDKDVGLCIGRQGCVIKHMQSTTNTRIQIPQQVANPGEQHRVATITGPAQGCQQVQQMIERIIAEQSSASVMARSPFQQHQQQRSQHEQQQYYAPQENQQGYSAEWAAYHAAQAAAALAQQHSHVQQNPAPAATAATDYHEQFFRYAYYYGEDAARQYYGAWSPSLGTPNPYGINPAGISPAPVAAPVAAPTVQATPAPAAAVPILASTAEISTPAAATSIEPTEARETSRRHVSNLPAWMTKTG
jgi:far upstream element-binding protein